MGCFSNLRVALMPPPPPPSSEALPPVNLIWFIFHAVFAKDAERHARTRRATSAPPLSDSQHRSDAAIKKNTSTRPVVSPQPGCTFALFRCDSVPGSALFFQGHRCVTPRCARLTAARSKWEGTSSVVIEFRSSRPYPGSLVHLPGSRTLRDEVKLLPVLLPWAQTRPPFVLPPLV